MSLSNYEPHLFLSNYLITNEMSGMYYNNPYANPYAAQNLQYGVNMPAPSSGGAEALGTASSLASFIPYVGPLVSAGLNFAGQAYQNYKQEQFYNEYMSPQARMAQMKAAGINPNAAAEGISGSSAPQMTAAAPSSAGNGVGEQLGNSVNTALTADVIRSQAEKNYAEAGLTKSLDVKQNIENQFVEREHMVWLNKAVADGEVSRSFANMAKVDEAYKGANAEASYQQLVANLEKTRAEVSNLAANTLHEFASVYQAMAAAALSEAQIHKVFSDIGLNNAMIGKIAHEVGEIDARTAATYQGINESKARTEAMNIANKFQNDYYAIWQNTGFNYNSDIEKSIVGAYSGGNLSNGDDIMNSLGRYIQGTGSARVKSEDFQWNSDLEVAKMITGIFKVL